jgi:hypothetical protein
VKRALAGASEDVQEEFYVLMEQLSRDAKNPELAIVPSKDAPHTFTAPFDEALVEFQDLADYPLLWVSRIIWLDN